MFVAVETKGSRSRLPYVSGVFPIFSRNLSIHRNSVLKSEQRQCWTGTDVRLVVDALYVVISRFWRDAQGIRDLSGGFAFGEPRKYLRLSSCKAKGNGSQTFADHMSRSLQNC